MRLGWRLIVVSRIVQNRAAVALENAGLLTQNLAMLHAWFKRLGIIRVHSPHIQKSHTAVGRPPAGLLCFKRRNCVPRNYVSRLDVRPVLRRRLSARGNCVRQWGDRPFLIPPELRPPVLRRNCVRRFHAEIAAASWVNAR